MDKRKVAISVAVSLSVVTGLAFGVHSYTSTHLPKDESKFGLEMSRMKADEAADLITKEAKLTIIDSDGVEHSTMLNEFIKVNEEDLSSYIKSGVFILDDFDEEKLKEYIHSLPLNEKASDPISARIDKGDNGEFIIVEETNGTKIDIDYLASDLIANILDVTTLNTSDYLVKPEVTSNDKKIKDELSKLKSMQSTEVTITYKDDSTKLPQDAIINSIKSDGTIDVKSFDKFIDELNMKYSNKGATVEFTTHDGQKRSFANNTTYSYSVDRAKMGELISNAIPKLGSQSIELKMQGKGLNDSSLFGGNYIEIDLNSQRSFVFKDGKQVFSWNVITGAPNDFMKTNVGIHEILYKQSPSVLRGSNADGSTYASPVAYWMPFNYEGEGIHDATWQTSGFGGDKYKYLGSHGCVNSSLSDAKAVWDLAYDGMPVIVWGEIYQ